VDAIADCTDRHSPKERTPWSRRMIAEKLADYHRRDSPWISSRQIAQQIDVPDRTLHHWVGRQRTLLQNSFWPHDTTQFFESPQGLDLLHRLVTAAHLVFVQANDCGLRNLGWFLQLSGLDQFVAPSYGAQQKVAEEMESLLIRFGEEEDRRLAAQMPPREITLCEDETFHPQICLVAIEPVSDFILLEQYQPQRDAVTWTECLGEKLTGLPISVCQVTSDQAKALIAHAEVHLGAHHSPDLFHVQHDTVQATSFALAGQTRVAAEKLEKAQQHTATLRAHHHDASQPASSQNSLSQVLWEHIQKAEAAEDAARTQMVACQDRQARAKAARQGLGRDYHPVDLQTGQPLTDAEVSRRLAGHFDTLDQVAVEAGLSAHAREKLAKARRVLDAMQATIAFFWTMVAARLAAWQLSEPAQQWVREYSIPAFYLRCAAEKAATAEERQRLRMLAEEILARARSPDGLWSTSSPDLQADLEGKAQQCAELFQRSSSCVEGRNGQLSLKHHALHQLTARKLRALTVLHNYGVRRKDGSTAAERFYGAAPRDLFCWLLDRISMPARPRCGRRAA
jgi:hypothetical protein